MKNPTTLLVLLLVLGFTFAFTENASARHRGHKDPVAAFIKRYDKNHNGTIDASEFPGSAEEFEKFDKNKDGKLETYEVKAYLAQHHGKKSKTKSGSTN